MPKNGEIRRASEIGLTGWGKVIWRICPDCGKERWVTYRLNAPENLRCRLCAPKKRVSQRGIESPHWKNGRNKTRQGYIRIWVSPDDFFYPMAERTGYIMEHRLVMAKHLGRNLQSWEKVHHKGIRYTGIENKQDNLLDNLELTSAGAHSLAHSKGYRDGYQQGLLDGRTKQIEELRQEIKLLQWQIKERV